MKKFYQIIGWQTQSGRWIKHEIKFDISVIFIALVVIAFTILTKDVL